MRKRSTGRVLAAAMVAAAGAVVPSQAAAAAPPGGGAVALPTGNHWTVTLVTGDVVEVTTVKKRPPLVKVRPGQGRKPIFNTTIRRDGHVIVVPSDAARRYGTVLDPALFDVTGLIRQGYDDAHSADIPLIVQGGGRSAVQGFAAARELRSLGAVAARQPKKRAVTLGRSLLGAGATRVWLDRKVKAAALPTSAARRAAGPKLDGNLSQVGAPAAWQAGVTGAGAKVAVLDSGIDENHPDLKGKIAEKKDFVGTTDAIDRLGNGTHVAALIAGSGAGSGGERKGVAPDASLVIGKVLDYSGSGTSSGIIEGLEWAAPLAKVVTLTVTGEETDGTDPLPLAIDKISAEYGTLVVAAAGNTVPALPGPWPLTCSVLTPASADSALAVGAVDGADKVAPFSCGGPRAGRPAAKPEITAPGVDIVAARAAGTSWGRPIDDQYTSVSGTPMATPHVAGAAALLLQRHPRWTGAQLKAALVGTSHALGGDVYRQGAGRLDVAAAVAAPLVSTDAVPHLGTSAFPAHPALTTKVGFTSTGPALTADLSVRVTDRAGKEHPDVAALADSRLAVPAGGTSRTLLTVNAAKAQPGFYIATVTARSGSTSVRTPVTFYVEPASHTLTVIGKPLPGTAPDKFSGSVGVTSLGGAPVDLYQGLGGPDKPLQIRVPDGTYSVLGRVMDGPESTSGTSVALGGAPEVKVDRDVTVTIDGAKAKQVTARVEGRETTQGPQSFRSLQSDGHAYWGHLAEAVDPKDKVYVQASGGVSTGSFRTYMSVRLAAPDTVWDLVEPLGDRLPADPSFVVTPEVQKRLARIDQRFTAFNGDTSQRMAERRMAVLPEGFYAVDAQYDVKPGSTRTDYVSAYKGLRWEDVAYPGPVLPGDDPTIWAEFDPFAEAEPGSRVTKSWGAQGQHPGFLAPGSELYTFFPAEVTSRTRGLMRIQVFNLQTRPNMLSGYIDFERFPWKMSLYEDDRKIGEKGSTLGEFKVGEKAATYRLTYENDLSRLLPVNNRTSSTWSFRSSGADAGTGVAALPLLQVQYDLGLDLLNRPTGAPATFTVARVAGTGSQKVTGLEAWTSLDDGKTWQPATVKPLDGGRFSAPLPKPGEGQKLTLRVKAQDEGGSSIDQTLHSVY
ncbi:S8 family serine peptidase [Actinomadura roseirufa]|uniref:S8 family serine peptidase n=1 Tax=Actinomadura roseirufa TaxID=2094049 RepID=UPI0010414A52|nr:S8 family serine peptidase [Actinomadura roseirufa]